MRSSQMQIRLMKQVPFEGPICKACIASQILGDLRAIQALSVIFAG
jgi:hypothetical protein